MKVELVSFVAPTDSTTSESDFERTGILSMTGEGEQGGSELTLDGTGTVTGKLYVSSKGGLLGGRMENSSLINVAVPAANMTIPITQTSTSIMERVSAK